MYAKICPDCGCYLDPGEKCDCREQRERESEAAKKRTQEVMTMIITENNGQMRMAV